MLATDLNLLAELGTGVAAVGGAVLTIQRIFSNIKKKKDAYRKAILIEAKKELENVRDDLEAKIKQLEIELHNQKESVSKDLAHLKENYTTEIKALGEKIENLRQDLTLAHQSLVTLLTQLVNKK